ncbi:MAG: c-type cytochrome [Rhodospirillales bacterium]|nr:c-type cytochrome [Rhodospirillales bacterium]
MSGKSNIILIAVILISVAIVGGAYINVLSGNNQNSTITWADPNDRALVKRGEIVYVEICATCHGDNLEGQENWQVKNQDGVLPAPPHDATGHTWHHPDSLLFQISKDGGQKNAPEGFISGMPGFGDVLSDDDIWASLAFIKSRWPEEIRKRHALIAERLKAN